MDWDCADPESHQMRTRAHTGLLSSPVTQVPEVRTNALGRMKALGAGGCGALALRLGQCPGFRTSELSPVLYRILGLKTVGIKPLLLEYTPRASVPRGSKVWGPSGALIPAPFPLRARAEAAGSHPGPGSWRINLRIRPHTISPLCTTFYPR